MISKNKDKNKPTTRETNANITCNKLSLGLFRYI